MRCGATTRDTSGNELASTRGQRGDDGLSANAIDDWRRLSSWIREAWIDIRGVVSWGRTVLLASKKLASY